MNWLSSPQSTFKIITYPMRPSYLLTIRMLDPEFRNNSAWFLIISWSVQNMNKSRKCNFDLWPWPMSRRWQLWELAARQPITNKQITDQGHVSQSGYRPCMSPLNGTPDLKMPSHLPLLPTFETRTNFPYVVRELCFGVDNYCNDFNRLALTMMVCNDNVNVM